MWGWSDEMRPAATEIFEQLTPWLIGLADKLRRVLDDQLSDDDRVMMLRAAAADVEMVWRCVARHAGNDEVAS